MEEWPSGLRRRFAKPLSRLRGSGGSNPLSSVALRGFDSRGDSGKSQNAEFIFGDVS